MSLPVGAAELCGRQILFEDSIFESTGRIRTRSRGWMVATFLLNGSILVALILIPLIYPEALPRQALTFLLTAPKAPPSQPPLPKETLRGSNSMATTVTLARPAMPPISSIASTDPVAPEESMISLNEGPALPGGTNDVFNRRGPGTVVHEASKGPMHVSSGVMAGAVIAKNTPVYPLIAKSAGVEGVVVLLATISKYGTIENLRVASGPALLQQAAIDAVKTWRYRPYLLNGEPVEVETTVNVVFSLGR
jgi:periplasmic protein TonB